MEKNMNADDDCNGEGGLGTDWYGT